MQPNVLFSKRSLSGSKQLLSRSCHLADIISPFSRTDLLDSLSREVQLLAVYFLTICVCTIITIHCFIKLKLHTVLRRWNLEQFHLLHTFYLYLFLLSFYCTRVTPLGTHIILILIICCIRSPVTAPQFNFSSY